jgi:ribosome-binding ATPase YchF (GTP1/OBG family)
MEFVDIAGLVAGRLQGRRLRATSFWPISEKLKAIAHVVRCFEDDNVIHVSNKVSPADDIEIINTELALADLESLQKGYRPLQSSCECRGQRR